MEVGCGSYGQERTLTDQKVESGDVSASRVSSRREFLRKAGLSIGAAAAIYVAPQFTSVAPRPAYASTTEAGAGPDTSATSPSGCQGPQITLTQIGALCSYVTGGQWRVTYQVAVQDSSGINEVRRLLADGATQTLYSTGCTRNLYSTSTTVTIYVPPNEQQTLTIQATNCCGATSSQAVEFSAGPCS